MCALKHLSNSPRYYTLGHDDAIDWILAIKPLRKLILHNCMIASWIRIDEDNMPIWNMPTHDWERIVASEPDSFGEAFAYKGAWSRCLDRFAAELPRLVDFRFDYGGNYRAGHVYGVKHREEAQARIFPQRYVVFDNGILPTHWPEADEDGTVYSWMDDGWPVNMHVVTEESDRRSLEGLVEVVRERASGRG